MKIKNDVTIHLMHHCKTIYIVSKLHNWIVKIQILTLKQINDKWYILLYILCWKVRTFILHITFYILSFKATLSHHDTGSY